MPDKFDGVDLGAALDAALQRVRTGETAIGEHEQRVAEAQAAVVDLQNNRDKAVDDLKDAWSDLKEVLQASAERSHVHGGVLGSLLSQPMPAE